MSAYYEFPPKATTDYHSYYQYDENQQNMVSHGNAYSNYYDGQYHQKENIANYDLNYPNSKTYQYTQGQTAHIFYNSAYYENSSNYDNSPSGGYYGVNYGQEARYYNNDYERRSLECNAYQNDARYNYQGSEKSFQQSQSTDQKANYGAYIYPVLNEHDKSIYNSRQQEEYPHNYAVPNYDGYESSYSAHQF